MVYFGVIVDSNEGFLLVFLPPALSSPFIRGHIGIDLCQTAKRQSNHTKDIKGENAEGSALTSPGKQCCSADVSAEPASIFPRAGPAFRRPHRMESLRRHSR